MLFLWNNRTLDIDCFRTLDMFSDLLFSRTENVVLYLYLSVILLQVYLI